jgi:hypothetical protein
VTGAESRTLNRTIAAAPVASFAFVAMLALAAVAVRNGLVADDTLRLWAGAGTAADGQVPIGRIVAGYPTLPFLATTLVAWLAPAGTPAPALVAAGIFSLIAAFCFLSFRRIGLPLAVAATFLIAFHPALVRAVIAGPADMLFAAFLLMFSLGLYDLRVRSGTSEVMHVGLALMALAFAHPVGAAFAFAAVPFLAFAVRPLLVASSALNVVIALIFPAVFMLVSFAYVSWVFPGAGWSFFAAPAQSLSLWTAAAARLFGDGLFHVPAIDASLAMGAALAVGAPAAVTMLALAYRRRPLVIPGVVFLVTAIAATVICVASGFFGEPTAIVVAAPVLAATVVIRIPIARERFRTTTVLLVLGWFGGFLSLALVDPITVNRLHAAFDPAAGERLDTIAAGGAFAERDGVLADTENAPALVIGRGRAHGILGPESEAFALAMLFARVDTPLIAVPDPQSPAGVNDRLDKAFPSLFREGLAGYRVIYQNNTWRLFAKQNDVEISKQ